MHADTVTCDARTHGPTNYAWKNGCRHPGAIAAHDSVLNRYRAERTAKRAEGLRVGHCVAALHHTEQAVSRGCICVSSKRVAQKARRCELAALAKYGETRLPGAMQRSYERFRGPRMRVNRFNLMLLLSGFVDSPTRGEMVAAVHILTRRGNRAGTGLLNWQEIADRLGVDDAVAHRHQRFIVEARRDRARRRRLDVLMKQLRVDRARQREAARRG
jgi:hypothetical protein